MLKRTLGLVLALLLVFGSLFGFLEYKNRMSAKMMLGFSPPPATVRASEVVTASWDQELSAVGVLTAVQGVDVSAEAGGIVQKVLFSAGDDVLAGTELLQLEDSAEQASLRSQEAQLQLAKINFERDQRLSKTQAISQTDLDKSEAEYNDARARVERTRALISKKLVRAPFSGRLGIREVSVGQYIDPGDSLVTLQALDTLYIDFSVPERFLPIIKVGQVVRCTVDAYPGTPLAGVISAVNVRSSDETHTVLVRATLNNQDRALIPGMFVDVSVVAGSARSVVVVPKSAISYSLYGNMVYVIEAGEQADQLVVERRYVQLGDLQRDGLVAIAGGLEAGERLVTAGQLKLRSGASVVIDNSPES